MNPEKGQQTVPPGGRVEDNLQQHVPLLAAVLGPAEHHGGAVVGEGLERLD